MKNLAQLKREAHKYNWKMLENKWFKEIPDYLKPFRKVSHVQEDSIGFITLKNDKEVVSYFPFPKAKDLLIRPGSYENDEGYFITFTGDCELTYFLRATN